ncbi:hypothetical protein HEP73_00503 [Xanthomonas sp. GW]|nr:hypothetical protein [Xanthomonas sp. GW]QNH19606.1 hypothetical protein HEP73_00503 [Xanthomonas sp. GW]
MTTQTPLDEMALRRKRAARTALVVGAVAVLIYAGFILSGVIGR